MYIGELYRIPNTDLNEFVNDYQQIFNLLSDCKNVVISSDHNLDLIKSSSHKPTAKFVEDLGLQGFVNVITKPTRVTHESETLIDNIFIKGPLMFDFESFVLLEDLSDHYPCVLRLDLPAKKSPCDKIIVKRKITDEVIAKLNRVLLFHDWSVLNPMNVDESYDYLVNEITSALDHLAPPKTVLTAQKDCFRELWMNVKLCKYNSKCKHMFKKARISNNLQLYNKYKMY